ncbi:MAG TPA: alpha-(1-_3)-arabinofuranosyltransferase family protein [Solirubrobacteraceae bacterium]|nr:alpha-(1->3)-arabinofuranosyltransferase family protein [Solirubrobacteraceae bacterium]
MFSGRVAGPAHGATGPRRAVPAGAALAVLAFALAFVQRPGLATADTKINLHVDPGRFLGEVASMWSSTGALGDVRSGQQAGYLFPMGPFYALGHLIGLPDWVVQRLWLGLLLWLAAWGVARLLTTLLGRASLPGELVAGAVIVLNPFVVTYANRTTVTFLAYAALPWLMLAVHHGLREPRRWRWPAAAALLVTASGGGINGAVTAWMLVGPALLLLYEWAQGAVDGAAVGRFLLRAVPLTALASLWWVIPAYVQSAYGINFLHFTEQPGTVWGTTSLTESLRLMSFWLSYVGVGFSGHAIPYFADSTTLLFSAPVVVGSLLLPALALAGFTLTRRWAYGPFFLALALVALLVMGAGFPEGTPLRHGLNFTYRHVAAVQFLRASYKAAPLLAVALACLAGSATAMLWPALAARRRPGAWRAGLVGAAAVVLALAAWPLTSGRAQDPQVSYHAIPAAWRAAGAGLDRELPVNARAVVLPGELFSFYTWGGTVDPILPTLTRRPVAERVQVPYADLRATDLLWTVDGLVHQQRLLPGQLPPLLSLIGARAVVTGTDDDPARSDAPNPADAAAVLGAQPGFARPARRYGPVRRFTGGGLGPAVSLPEVRRYDLPSARGLVRVEPVARPLIVDGSAAGLAGLAAFGALPAGRSLRYAADLSPAQLRRALAAGGDLVVTDTNRRQAYTPGSLDANTGWVLTPDENVSADGLILDPFVVPGAATAPAAPDETVAAYSGVRDVQAPFSPLARQFPAHAPFAALDGNPATAWLADPSLTPDQRWLQVDFTTPREVGAVDVLPAPAQYGTLRSVGIAGRSFALHPGWNHLVLGLPAATALRLAPGAVTPAPGGGPGAGGIAELRIPGVHATESLRLPIDATSAVAGSAAVARAGLTYLFSRQTGDDPFARDPEARSAPLPGPASPPVMADAETVMHRRFDVPVARRFRARAWVTPLATADDAALDRLAGTRGAARVTSSDRFQGRPGLRAAMALDGDPATAWVADWSPVSRPWLAVALPAPVRVRVLRLAWARVPVRRPTSITVSWPGGAAGPLTVAAGGAVTLPRAVRLARLRVTIDSAAAVTGSSSAQRSAVGIGELTGLGRSARLRVRHAGRLSGACGAAAFTVAGVHVALRVTGTLAALDAGTPLPAVSCGAPFALAAGPTLLSVAPGPLAVDALALRSPPPGAPTGASTVAGAATAGGASTAGGADTVGGAVPPPTGRVLSPGTVAHGAYHGVRVQIRGPSWLVLGEGYNRGWQATCNGHSLGAPVPIDGYANGWRVGPGCRKVAFTYGPERLATLGYALSALACLGCVIVLLLAWRRRRRDGGPATAPIGELAPQTPRRIAPGRALAAALVPALAFAFVFGLRPGLVSWPALAAILWLGLDARVLTLAAAGLLGLLVPALYLADPGRAPGGNQFGYAMAHLDAHYVAVAAFGLLAVALWRSFPRRGVSDGGRGPRRAPRPGRVRAGRRRS